MLRDAVSTKRIDPLLGDAELALSEMFYPAGFPLRLATNSRDVLDAAGQSWGLFQKEFDTPAMEFRVLVEPGGQVAAEPTFRKQGHLLLYVSDAHNFAVGDSRTLSAGFNLSQATAAEGAGLRWFYLEAMAYMLLTQRYVVSLHAGCVARNGGGILICGPSGAGKSTLAFACARAGLTYVSDDCTRLLAGSAERMAIGNPHRVRFRQDAARHFPELGGYLAATLPNGKFSIELPTSVFPAIDTASLCPIRALVFLDRAGDGPPRAERMRAEDVAESLIEELPSYGPEVNAMHETAIHGLTGLPAWRLRYASLDDGVRLLSELAVPAESRA
jgi:hypothetical protein